MASSGPTPLTVSHASKARLLRQAAARDALWIVARGDSMGRAVPNGWSVLVAPHSTPRRGQVWAYCDAAGNVVVHRYRRHVEDGHVLQGDTCADPDAPVRGEQLIGRVAAVRYGDRVRSVGGWDRGVFECRRVARAVITRASRILRRLRPAS